MDIIQGNLDLSQTCLVSPVYYQHFQPYGPESSPRSFAVSFLICTARMLAPAMDTMIKSMKFKKASCQPPCLIVDSVSLKHPVSTAIDLISP